MRHTVWLLGLLACHSQGVDTGDSGDPDGRLELGRIEGTVSRSVDYEGDGVGHLLVLGFYNIEPQLDYYPANSLVIPYVDITAADFELDYALTHLFPEPSPYYVATIFDDDGSVMETGDWEPTSGDLLSAPFEVGYHEPIYVGSGESVIIDLTLTTVYQP